ncbi:hypothetical protein [Sediminimonas qiaohouensis]|uniref:hypothetical protein n=1 Tax=Sediminimonas qiaohouensis TaxID=552061 RepID=UPI002352E66F|nr:hypothetical protein [Sediminimonas qiaohouensis]
MTKDQREFRADLIKRDGQDIPVELIDREHRGQHAQCIGVGFPGHRPPARLVARRTLPITAHHEHLKGKGKEWSAFPLGARPWR